MDELQKLSAALIGIAKQSRQNTENEESLSRNSLTLGFYENFPSHIHMVESFHFKLFQAEQLQQKLIQVLYEINQKRIQF